MSKAIRNNQKVILLIPPPSAQNQIKTIGLYSVGGGGEIRQDKIKHTALYFKRGVRDVY